MYKIKNIKIFININILLVKFNFFSLSKFFFFNIVKLYYQNVSSLKNHRLLIQKKKK